MLKDTSKPSWRSVAYLLVLHQVPKENNFPPIDIATNGQFAISSPSLPHFKQQICFMVFLYILPLAEAIGFLWRCYFSHCWKSFLTYRSILMFYYNDSATPKWQGEINPPPQLSILNVSWFQDAAQCSKRQHVK